jgi:hypothetical protein
MPEFSSSNSNETGVELVLADLDLALTFMDVAATSRIQETKDRNHRNARHAYDTVLHLLKSLEPDSQERSAIDGKMALLKTRLQAVGQQF